MTTPATPAPVEATPRRMRIWFTLMALLVVAVMVTVSVLLKTSTTGVVAFRTSDQVATMGIGLLIGGAILYCARPRMTADAQAVTVRNIVGTHVVPWEHVRAVRFDEHSPWASLLLSNEDEMSVLAVQAADGERAVRAVEGMRALLAADRVRGVV